MREDRSVELLGKCSITMTKLTVVGETVGLVSAFTVVGETVGGLVSVFYKGQRGNNVSRSSIKFER